MLLSSLSIYACRALMFWLQVRLVLYPMPSALFILLSRNFMVWKFDSKINIRFDLIAFGIKPERTQNKRKRTSERYERRIKGEWSDKIIDVISSYFYVQFIVEKLNHRSSNVRRKSFSAFPCPRVILCQSIDCEVKSKQVSSFSGELWKVFIWHTFFKHVWQEQCRRVFLYIRLPVSFSPSFDHEDSFSSFAIKASLPL